MVHVKNAPDSVIEILSTDQTTPPAEYLLSRTLNAVTVTSTTIARSNTIELQAGHNVVPGNYLEIYNVDPDTGMKRFGQIYVVSVATNTLRLGRYVGFAMSPASVQFAKRVSVNMNVVGTIDAPVKFEMGPPNGFQWDLTRTMLVMITAGTPDDSRFGDIAGGVTNGIFFGFESDLTEQYLVNIRKNAGLRGTAYDVSYVPRTLPAGSYGVSMRKSFSGMDKYGVVIRLSGRENAKFVCYVQDDLSTFIEFGIKPMGHHTTESGTL